MSSPYIEIYLIDKFLDSFISVTGLHSDLGIAVETDGLSNAQIVRTTAHELGHRGSLWDIASEWAPFSVKEYEADYPWIPEDKSSVESFDIAPNYYDRDFFDSEYVRTQEQLIWRLLMRSQGVPAGTPIAVDIPRGDVYGVRTPAYGGAPGAPAMMKVGLNSSIDRPPGPTN